MCLGGREEEAVVNPYGRGLKTLPGSGKGAGIKRNMESLVLALPFITVAHRAA